MSQTSTPMACDKAAADLFARHGLRCTKQRLSIYRALTATRHHPTADDLYCSVGGEAAGMSLATVYNTLDAFTKAGLIQRLPGVGGTNGSSSRYDAHQTPHIHLRDSQTGDVEDTPDDLSAQLLKHIPKRVLDEIKQRTGFTVDQVQIELVGRFEGRG